MCGLRIDDPNWVRTFPHVVAPLHDECLPGCLWRCDEANGWPKNTTESMSLLPPKKGERRAWRSVVTGEGFDFDKLAELLAVPSPLMITETTFQAAQLRFLPPSSQPYADKYRNLWQGFSFQKVCPACISEGRLIRISSAVPDIHHCHIHQLEFLERCSCGAYLSGHLGTCPFICHNCGLDWKNLPRISADPQKLVDEKLYLSLYQFFLTEATWLDLERICSWLREEYDEEFLYPYFTTGIRDYQDFFLKYFPSSVLQARHELHGNISLALIIQKLIKRRASLREVILLAKSPPRPEQSCLNHSCPLFGVTDVDNSALFGYYQLPSGTQEPIWYCKECGSCYHNHRLCFTFDRDCFGSDSPVLYPSENSIARARWHLEVWKDKLRRVCRRRVKQGRGIDLREVLEEAYIPWKPNLLAARLGLVEIVETYVRLQQKSQA